MGMFSDKGNEELYEETKRLIYLSSINFDIADSVYHDRLDECYAEWRGRGLESEYERAHVEVSG